jgi:hypothetical protein
VNLSKHEKTCRHCGQPFRPDLRNRARQHYCYKPACRKARKDRSHRIWRAKNPDHFKGEWNVDHVRQWRALHPGYWRRPKANPKAVRPESSAVPLPAKNHRPDPALPLQDGVAPLQDSITRNHLILGLISHVFGCTLQDCVEKIIPELIIKGMEIRTLMDGAKTICKKSAKHDAQKTRVSRRPVPAAGAGQTACSPSSAG